ncbi:MAG: CvpA family protein [Bacteroidia bacterium]|nr:CvpA family protein [Bacteroidia bacterium]
MPEGLTFIDIIAAIGIGFGLIRGWTNGIIKEVAGLIGVVLGIWAGFRFAFIFANYYQENFELPEAVIPFLAFLTAFILVLVIVFFIGRMLKFLLDKTNLSVLNQASGALFGGLKFAFLVGSLIGLIGKAGFISEETKGKSIAYPFLTTYCEGVMEYSIGLIPAAKNVFKDMDEYFDKIQGENAPEGGDSDDTTPEEQPRNGAGT